MKCETNVNETVLLSEEIDALLEQEGCIPESLQESYDRLIFSIFALVDLRVLFNLESQNFEECHDCVLLKYCPDPRGMGAWDEFLIEENLSKVANGRLERLFHKYRNPQSGSFFSFVQPVVFSMHLKKLLLFAGITRHIIIKPTTPIQSGLRYYERAGMPQPNSARFQQEQLVEVA